MKSSKREIRQKRLDILVHIDRLEKNRCENCSGTYLNQDTLDCQCPAAKEIRACGVELIKLSNKGKEVQMERIAAQVKKDGGLLPETYRELRNLDMTDQDICNLLNIYRGKLLDFKHDYGLTKRKGPRHFEMTEKHKRVAAENKVPLNIARRRIRIHGWPVSRAISEPVNNYKSEFNKWAAVAIENGLTRDNFRIRLKRGESMESAATRPKGQHLKKVANGN